MIHLFSEIESGESKMNVLLCPAMQLLLPTLWEGTQMKNQMLSEHALKEIVIGLFIQKHLED